MSRKLLYLAACVAALSVSAAHAQDATSNNQTASTSQSNANAAPSTDTSAYGGAMGKSASGSMKPSVGMKQPDCVGPASFCDIYKGGQ
jgi:hypothetical protein